MKYRSPDLIQRIYQQAENGDSSKYQEVLTDLRTGKREFQLEFDLKDRKVRWTCFEASYVYFYLADPIRELEMVIPGHTWTDDLKRPMLDKTPFFHCIWVLGEYFPGLQNIRERPLKIHLQPMKRDGVPIKKLNYWLKKMLLQYDARTKPIFEAIDMPKDGKRWKKIVQKSRKGPTP
jgi:hypothetical protein